jgi:hypothetical protein
MLNSISFFRFLCIVPAHSPKIYDFLGPHGDCIDFGRQSLPKSTPQKAADMDRF